MFEWIVTLKGHTAALGAFLNAWMSNVQDVQSQQQQQQVDPNHVTFILVEVAN